MIDTEDFYLAVIELQRATNKTLLVPAAMHQLWLEDPIRDKEPSYLVGLGRGTLSAQCVEGGLVRENTLLKTKYLKYSLRLFASMCVAEESCMFFH